MAPLILALIPSIFGFIANHVGSVVSDVSKSNITSKLLSLGSNITSSGILGVIEAELGQLASEKRALIQADLDILLSQSQIVESEINSPKPWYKVPHEIVEMSADVYIGTIFLLATIHALSWTLGLTVPFIGFDSTTVTVALTFSGGIKAYKALT